MADTFDMNAVQGALVTTPNNHHGKQDSMDGATNGGAPNGTDQVWAQREAYDYAVFDSNEHFEGSARVYQWSDEFGDVGPKFEELELELFGDPEKRHERKGINFAKRVHIERIEVSQEGPSRIVPVNAFKDAGLHPVMLENVDLCGYDCPTPIQKFAIPSILQGYDVIGIAQTGSGKTAAYLIPILSKLMGKAKKLAAPRPNPATFREGVDFVTAEPLVLVVVPTRELAVQIFNEARKLCYRTMLRPAVVYGGLPIREQINLLSKGCDVLIGTPGRLIDFIQRPHNLTLRRLKYMVLDEADEMLGASWEEDLRQILAGGGIEQDEGNVKYGLFSATFPKAARDLAQEYLSASHVRFRVGRAGSTTENIKQNIIQCSQHEKRDHLITLLNDMHGVRTIVFVNSRQEADNLDDFLFNTGLPVTSIHSDRTQSEREAAMRAFRRGDAPILVATGVTARGIDVQNVMHVINYDLPSMEHGGIEEYTHRIGRTGRIGHLGVATSFFTERDEDMGSILARTLLETKQELPDFLDMYAPQGDSPLQFETESNFDANDLGNAADVGRTGDVGDAWGGAGTTDACNGFGDSGDSGAAATHSDAWSQAGGDTIQDSGSGWGGDHVAHVAVGEW